jgi:hypothetical protein
VKACTIIFQRCLAILLTVFLAVSAVRASPLTVVKVAPQQSNAAIGQTFSLNITIVDVQNLYGLEVTLLWNASVLEAIGIDVRLGYESHSDGVLHEIPGTADVQIYENETRQDQGTYVLAASSIAPASSFNGSGIVAQVTFQAKSDQSCSLRVQAKLYDKPLPGEVSEQIPHSTEDGMFGHVPEGSPFLYVILAAVGAAVITATGLYLRTQHRKRKLPESPPASQGRRKLGRCFREDWGNNSPRAQSSG